MLALAAPVSEPERVWRRLWDLSWRAVSIERDPVASAFTREYFEDLLPDHESHLMGVAKDRLEWMFWDFGGAFSRQIGPLAHWFEIGLARQYRAVLREIESAGGRLVPSALPDIDRVLRRSESLDAETRVRPMLVARGSLWSIFREHDGTLTISGLDAPTDEERASAARLWSSDETEDPIHLAGQRWASHNRTDRREFEHEWQLRRVTELDRTLRASNETPDALLDAMLCAVDDPRVRDEATVLLERNVSIARSEAGLGRVAIRITDERLAVRAAAVAMLERVAKSATSAQKGALVELYVRVFETKDPRSIERVLSIEVEAKRVSNELLAAALANQAIVASSAVAATGLQQWLDARMSIAKLSGGESEETLALVRSAVRLLLRSPSRVQFAAALFAEPGRRLKPIETLARHTALSEPLREAEWPWRLEWALRHWSDATSLGTTERDADAWIADALAQLRRESNAWFGSLVATWIDGGRAKSAAHIEQAWRSGLVGLLVDVDPVVAARASEALLEACRKRANKRAEPAQRLREFGAVSSLGRDVIARLRNDTHRPAAALAACEAVVGAMELIAVPAIERSVADAGARETIADLQSMADAWEQRGVVEATALRALGERMAARFVEARSAG